jgi:nucleoside-diphosphate-sugar epimerase
VANLPKIGFSELEENVNSLRSVNDMGNKTRVLVTGAGGFIGHHLVKRLKAEGHGVRGVDLKHPEYEDSAADDFRMLDLRL